jgi:hypothetical protein
MSTCDFSVTLDATQQPITVKSDTSQCCTINVMNDVDITNSYANNTVLVWDNEFNLWVRKFIDANNISGLNQFIVNFLIDNDIEFGANVSIGGTLTVPDIYITNDLTVDGDIILKGSTITLGDGGDVININATVNNHIIATSNNTYNLGSTTNYWKNLYVNDVNIANNLTVNNITVIANVHATTVNSTTVNTTNLYTGDIVVDNSITVGDVVIGGDTINFGTFGGGGNTVFNLYATVNNNVVATYNGIYNLGNTTNRWNTLYAIDVDLTGNLTVDGDIFLKGNTLTLGDGGDVININATVNNHITPTTTNYFDLGSSSSYWRTIYANTFRGYNNVINIGDCSTNNSIINLCGNVNFGTAVSISNNTVKVGDVSIADDICYFPPETTVNVTGGFYVGNTADPSSNTIAIDPEICYFPPPTELKVGGVINLANTATVNNSIVSSANNTYDIGTTDSRWRNVYANYYYGDGRYLDNVSISKGYAAAPTSLANGQLHYSFSSDKLYIGQTDTETSAVSVEYIGGKLLVDKVANLESIIGVSGDSATFANTIISGVLRLSSYPENAALRTKAGGVVEAITGSSGEIFQVAANGSPLFDDLNGGTY